MIALYPKGDNYGQDNDWHYSEGLSCFYHISSAIRRSFFSFQNNPKDQDPSVRQI